MSTNVKLAPKVKIAQILEKKKREDPVGLITAQKNGTMAEFLADDLRALGINPASVVFGGNPSLNVGGAQSISKNLKSGLTDESKPVETVKQTINQAQEIEAPKCPCCKKNVFKMDEILFLEKEWHKDCFVCGLGNSIGCKRLLAKGEYETHSNIAYCKACFSHNFQLGAARGAVLNVPEASKGAKSVSETANIFKTTSSQITSNGSSVKPSSNSPDRFRAFTSNTAKCTVCTKSVYKVEEVVAIGSTWHKGCFTCGGTSGQGCKRVLTLDSYEHRAGSPYCRSCFNRLFKAGASAASAATINKTNVATEEVPQVPVEASSVDSTEGKELHPLKSYQNLNVNVTALTSNYAESNVSNGSPIKEATSQVSPNRQGSPSRDRLKSYMNMNVNMNDLKNAYSSNIVSSANNAEKKTTSAVADRFRSSTSNTAKCAVCTKSVYKVEEVVAIGSTWHKGCFTCGGTSGQGCKRVLTLDSYEHRAGSPYCRSCFNRLFKAGASAASAATINKINTNTNSDTTGDAVTVARVEPVVVPVSVPEPVPVPSNAYTGTSTVVNEESMSMAERSAAFKARSSTSSATSNVSNTSSYSKTSSAADKFRVAQSTANKCPCCSKTVYKAEEIFAGGDYWHQMCFTCGGRGKGDPGCKRRLNATTFQLRNGEPYCRTCFDRIVKESFQKGTVVGTANKLRQNDSTTTATVTTAPAPDQEISNASSQPIMENDNTSSITSSPRPIDLVETTENNTPRSATSSNISGYNNVLKNKSTVPKCFVCSQNVYKMEEILAMEKSWHKSCFCCGVGDTNGCKKMLSSDGYEVRNNVPYCYACFLKSKKLENTNIQPPLPPVAGIEKSIPKQMEYERQSETVRESFDITQVEFHVENNDDVSISHSPETEIVTEEFNVNLPEYEVDTNQFQLEETGIIENTNTTNNNNNDNDDDNIIITEEDKIKDEDDEDIFSIDITNPVEFHGSTYRGRYLKYENDFDEKGVIYSIGTNNKTMSFTNPQLLSGDTSGGFTIVMSSCYKGKPENITSRSIPGIPTYTENSLNSWIKIDLGSNYSLLADQYTLKHGCNSRGNALRNWSLQAKPAELNSDENISTEDGNNSDGWITLREHINDETITGDPDSTGTWSLDIPEDVSAVESSGSQSASTIGFRYFRIVQHGPNANGNNCLFCCGIELYGVLFEKMK